MTTGSWSTYRETYVSTACSVNSVIRNGTKVSWAGGDSTAVRRKKLTYKERESLFLKSPEQFPNGPLGRRKFIIDNARTAGLTTPPGDIFDRTRTVRTRIYEGLPPVDDYGTPHAFTKTWTTYGEVPFPWYYSNGSYAGMGSIANCGFSPDAAYNALPWLPSDDYKLLSRLRRKVVGTEFNLASFLGAEGLDTLRFFTDTATRLYRVMQAAKKLKFKDAYAQLNDYGRYSSAGRAWGVKRRGQQLDVYRDLIESAAAKNRGQGWWSVPASAWLEFHLAVEPLLGDAVAAAEQLAHITGMPVTQRVQASVTKKKTFSGSENVTGSSWTGQAVTGRNVVAYFTSTPEPLNFLGFQDPEVVIWNAIPLSFVGDYFYDIGGFLEARATARAFPVGTYVISTKIDVDLRSCLGRVRNKAPWNVISPSYQGSLQYRSGSLTRTLSASYDVPKPLFKPLGALGNWQRAATVASLIATFSDRFASRRNIRG